MKGTVWINPDDMIPNGIICGVVGLLVAAFFEPTGQQMLATALIFGIVGGPLVTVINAHRTR